MGLHLPGIPHKEIPWKQLGFLRAEQLLDQSPLMEESRYCKPNVPYHNGERCPRHKILFGVGQVDVIRRFDKLHTTEFFLLDFTAY